MGRFDLLRLLEVVVHYTSKLSCALIDLIRYSMLYWLMSTRNKGFVLILGSMALIIRFNFGFHYFVREDLGVVGFLRLQTDYACVFL